MEEIPAGFRRIASGPVVLVLDPALETAARALSLLEPDGLARAFRGHPDGALGRSATRLVAVPNSDDWLVLRRLCHGGLLGPLLRDAFWGLRRPLRELAVTATLHRAGAPVPRPALVAGRRIAGPLWSAAVGTYLETDALDALSFLEADPDRTRILAACAALGRAVRRFHDAGGRHGDLHVKNLLVREQGDIAQGVVIDLDKARITPGLTPEERMAQIMRLFRSLVKRGVLERVGPRGCARFFGTYCGNDRLLRRALWRRVRPELRKTAIHALRYPRPSERASRA